MPKASVTRQIAREKQKLIDFVLDIEKYPEFIPFCIDSKVYERNDKKDEILQVMDDLKAADVDFLTIGQYLQPSVRHHPLDRYYTPEEFDELGSIAKAKGFLLVSSSPLTRSSYHADEDFAKLQQNRINNH